jgi:hypothetical protein
VRLVLVAAGGLFLLAVSPLAVAQSHEL